MTQRQQLQRQDDLHWTTSCHQRLVRIINVVVILILMSGRVIVDAWVPTTTSLLSNRRSAMMAITSSSFQPSRNMLHVGRFHSISLNSANDNSEHSDDDNRNDQRLNFDEESNDQTDLSPSVRKRIRLAKAQAEIDRILNHPVDPPFDFEGVMEKVISISRPEEEQQPTQQQINQEKHSLQPPTPQADDDKEISSATATLDLNMKNNTANPNSVAIDDDDDNTTKKPVVRDIEQLVSKVEGELYGAVKAQDFETAAERQSELSQMHIDDCGLVLQLNSAFYKAFSDKDVREMERVWLKDRACVCIHPSFKVLTGIRSIMDAWKNMFESSSGSFQRTWIEPDKIQLTVRATTAVVTCEELVYAKRFVRGEKRRVELVNKLTATNLFRKVGGRWYMTHHHSSWHADSQPAKVALKSKKKGQNGTRRPGLQLRRGLIDNVPNDDASDNDDDEEEAKRTGIENILGTSDFGPVLGDDPKDQPIPGRSMFPGAGSDPLGSLLSSLGAQEGVVYRIEDIQMDENDFDGDENDAIDVDEDDDDDDNGSDDLSTHFKEEGRKRWEERRRRIYREKMGLSALRQFDRMKLRDSRRVPEPSVSRSSSSSSSSGPSTSQSKKCITALRRLASQGRISQKQKRVLLSDIISSSSNGKNSMVETAYNLLCSSDGNDESPDEDSEEDFADQCLFLADSLLVTKNNESPYS